MPTRFLFCGALVLIVGCQSGTDQFNVDDLTPDEYRVVERFVVLERARAIALTDAEQGVAILDSLATAWGDSAAVEAEDALTDEPARAALVHDLIRRLLEAETDSLVAEPVARRLTAPLPEPVPADD